VQLDNVKRLDFDKWCEGLALGRSYVSDGFAHALKFSVNSVTPGRGEVMLAKPGSIKIQAHVAFASETPRTVAQGTLAVPAGERFIGDTVTLHGPRIDEMMRGGRRLVEIVVNGAAAASTEVPADGQVHNLSFEIDVKQSSWVALRQFPQLHTNPVNVLVGGKPIRASRKSARWCIETIEQLWRARGSKIAEAEREEARRTFDQAVDKFRRIAAEAPEGS
jgi:hypothetical protein